MEVDVPPKEESTLICKKDLVEIQPKADYKELLELTAIYLYDAPSSGIRLRQRVLDG